MRIALIVLLCSGVMITSVQAADIGGRIKLDGIAYAAGANTPEATLGYRHSSELAAQLRLDVTQDVAPWKFEAAWQFDARHGSAMQRDAALAASYPTLAVNDSDDSYWDLSDEISNRGQNQSSQRLDRLNVSYSGTVFVARLGRQALTWGSGQVFHPMDLVNPFQPVATDTVYKRGTDMVYGQWLLNSGGDIQLVIVPHTLRTSTDPNGGKPTQAVFANLPAANLQWTLLLANDRADTVLGLGASGALADASWNAEVIPTRLERGGTRTSWLLNISQAGTFLKRNLSGFAEFYHNGFGETGDYSVTQLNRDLETRLARGQVFVTGKDYLCLGVTWEWTPLLQLLPTLIVNLHDHSALFDTQLSRSLSDNVSLKAGVRLALGGQGTEFGGLRLSPTSNLYLGQTTQAFVRLEAYF